MAPYMNPGSSGADDSSSDRLSPSSVDGNEIGPDIAIIGLSFQFPEADTEESLWELMNSGRSAATEFPADRLSSTKFFDTEDLRTGTIRSQKASFLKRDISCFDPKMFGFTADEAAGTDPQQRILLETTYRALENAGVSMQKISGSATSVHVGCFTADYTLCVAKDPEKIPKYTATGVAASMLSNRISLFYNISGPSLTVDTACSSSLVALDLACRSLRQGESTMGIVAGSNLLFVPDYFMSLSNLGFLSPDGVCHSFDNRANGYGRGEGFGVLIIKPLDAAVRDGDTIRAVIRATAANQNGRTSLAQPSKEMQQQLIEDTYRKHRLDMSLTRYFEAHGTGTSVGDPLEAMAIGNSFRSGRDPDDPVIIGALKASIGHLEGAAGIAGVIKTVLVLERGLIPPIADLKEVNTSIDAEFLKLKFPTTPTPWPSKGLRRASVNSFGFGGTNAHAILDDAYHYLKSREIVANHCTSVATSDLVTARVQNHLNRGLKSKSLATRPRLFVWSAHEKHTATEMQEVYRKHLERLAASVLESGDEKYLEALAYTLTQRRSLHDWKVFEVADSVPRLVEQLLAPKNPVLPRSNPRVGFVFTGQGAQWAGMGKELFIFPVFQNSVKAADKVLQSIGCEWRATDILTDGEKTRAKINEPRFAQTLCTILQVAVVELLRSFHIYPETAVGHSSGEIAAAYAIGAISRQSAWKLAYFRGFFSSQLAELTDTSVSGTMMAVGLSESAARPYIGETLRSFPGGVLTIACVNSPKNVTLSGDKVLIEAQRVTLEQESVFARVLKVPVAYHSPHMLRIAASYLESIGKLEPGESPRRFANMVSSVTGDIITKSELLKAEYWVRNMVSPVRFSDAVGRICRDSAKKAKKKLNLSHRNFASVSDLLEIGPHSALQGPIRETIEVVSPSAKNGLSYTAALIRGRAATDTLLEAAGKLYCLGFDVSLETVNGSLSSSDRVMTLPELPEYPFDQTHSYWEESRISRNIRIQSQPYNEFLGLPVSDWNPLEPRWRNTLKVGLMPWMEDHKINGEVLFPGAGMMVMAVEAMIQISEGQNITGFELRDTAILSALTLPADDSGVDTLFCLRPSLDSSKKGNAWATFSLYSCRKDNFVEISRGSIKAVYDSQSHSEFDGQDVQHTRDWIEAAHASYGSEVTRSEVYGTLEANGYGYGPIFQGIESVRRSGTGQALGVVSTEGFPPMGNVATRAPKVIHPCTLDSILQLCLPGIVRVGSDQMATYVPTYIAKGWVSNTIFDDPEKNSHLYVHATSKNRSVRLVEANIHVVGQNGGGLLLQTEGIELTLVNDEVQSGSKSSQLVRRLCFDMVDKPDPTLLSSKELQEYAQKPTEATPDPTEFLRTLKLHILASIFRASNTVAESEIPAEQPHLHKQYAWMKSAVEDAKHQPPSGVPSSWMEHVGDAQFKKLCDRLTETGRLGEIYVHFGSNLVDMLRGNLDSLQVLVPDGRLKDFYDYSNNLGHLFAPLHNYIDSLAHKNPGMKILELGAGTAGMTRRLLDTLAVKAPNGIYTRFSQYDFTDISASFLESAADEFDEYPKMNYRLCNIEEDPAGQGYEEHSYDLIVCSNVLHVTRSLQETLTNIRKLLKDDGKLAFIEITQPAAHPTQSVFGFLPGWWLGTETWRQKGPCATAEKWDQELKGTGFTGVDLRFDDFKLQENKVMSLLVSTVTPASVNGVNGVNGHNGTKEEAIIKNKKAVVVSGWNKPSDSSPLAELAISKLKELGITDANTSSFSETASQTDLGDTLIVVVQEGGWLSLADFNAEQYGLFHTTLTRASNIMWISDKTPTFQTKQVSPRGPVQGMSRALRSEMQGLVFATVTLDFSSSPAILASHVEKALGNFLQGVNSHTYERELIQEDDLLCIPRVYENGAINQKIHDFASDTIERKQPFGELNVRLRVGRPGLLDSIFFEEVPESGPLGPGEIEVEVKSIGVNFRDCLIALGRVDQDTLGTECAGVVRNTGSACKLKPGDSVLVCALDTFHGLFRCDERLAVKKPDNMTFTDAGALPINFVTAYHALIRLARLAAGESVLIHSGAGGTGQAAIQLAQHCGAEIYTTVGSASKREFLTSEYGIPPERILNSRDLSFAGDIKRLTNNKGVDVVLNALAGDALVASWECVAPYGRFLEIGKLDIYTHNTLPMFQFARNVSFSAIDIAAIILERPDVIQDELSSVVELFQSKVLRMPSPLKSFPISEVEAAFRYLQSGTNAGKVVVEVDPEDIVPAVIAPKSDWTFSPKETFMIAGGLGAQGRSIADWMVSKGARNLVLLSRGDISGNSEIAAFVQDLQSRGATVYCPSCDIGDPEAIRAVIDYCEAHLPPIKGCINAAMDLKDSIFENVEYEGWSTSLRPKVQGSWNLHEQLPRDLDFFILFSSIAGVLGSQGQSNYAAGNTYQDELAKFRLSKGEKAISLSFPMLANYGFAVNYKEAARRFVHSRYVMEMWQPEVLALMEHYCDKRLPLDPTTSQIVMGLELPEDIISRGIDPVGWMNEPMFSNLHQMGSSNAEDSGNSSARVKGPDLITQLQGVESLPEAAEIAANGIAAKVCRVLSLSQDAFDVAQPLHTYGVDSLIAVEMRNWFLQILKVDVAVFEILGGATAATLGRAVVEKMRAGS